MPAHRLDMRLVREVLRLRLGARLSCREVASALGVSVGTVSNYVSAFDRAGLSFPLPGGLGDEELARRLFPPPEPSPPSPLDDDEASARFVLPDFAAIRDELRRKGVTRLLLWEEYRAEHGPERSYAYTQFCVLYRRWLGRQRLSMRQNHAAGEKLFVDYAGQTVDIVDAATGEAHAAQIFVAVLGASSYTFAEATMTQKLADWTSSHVRAFEFFRGVPALVVPDNLRSGVTRACRYEPELNRTYQELLAHYGTCALPARPRKPKDKAKAEVGVQIVSRWILARLRNRAFFSLFELNLEIRRLLEDLNDRPFRRMPDASRRSRFEELDRPALRPVPAARYEYAEWRRARVGIDCHIEVERHFYSVPHAFARREVEVRLTASALECFAGGRRVAVHVRSRLAGRHSTQAEHLPKSHRAHLEWTPGRLHRWAAGIGASAGALVADILASRPHPEMGYRSCLGLLGLAKRYGAERLEAACRIALANGTPTRRSVHSVLAQGIDRLPPEEEKEKDDATPSTASPIAAHENVRGARYYH